MSPRLGELMLASSSDERLVKLARAGHERAFAVIVERYRPELSAFARRLSPDGKAEDIVQQAFLSAFAALRAGADVKHLRGWLYRIVRNAAARSQAPRDVPLNGATASDESVEDVVQQRDLAKSALAEVARLPVRQRQAIVGTALDGRGRAEVATSMGVTEGAVRQLVHRARVRIRTAVTAVAPWPLMRWLVPSRPSGGGAVSAAAGVGTGAASSGVAVKLGIVIASGAIATGVAEVGVHGGAHRAQPGGRQAVARAVHPRAARDNAQVLAVAMAPMVPLQVDRPRASRPAGALALASGAMRVRGGGDGAVVQLQWQRSAAAGVNHGNDRGTARGLRLSSGSAPLWGGGWSRPGDGDGSRSGGGGSHPGGGGGSRPGDGAGSGPGGGSGSTPGGGAASGHGGAAASARGDGGSGQNGGGWHDGGGGQGRDGRSSSAPQAVIAAGGRSTSGGYRSGGQDGSGNSGPGSRSGSGSASGSGDGAGSGAGSGSGGSSGGGSGGSVSPGPGPGAVPGSAADPGSTSGAGASAGSAPSGASSGSGSAPGSSPSGASGASASPSGSSSAGGGTGR